MFKHEPLYRDALTHGLTLMRKHPLLLVYGLFAAALGQMGVMELVSKIALASGGLRWTPASLDGIRSLGQYNWKMISLPAEGWGWLAVLLTIILGLGLAFSFAAVVSQGALIWSVGQSTRRRSFPHLGKAWHVGVEHFWRLLLLNILRKVGIGLLAVAVGWATVNVAVAEQTTMGDVWLFFTVFVLACAVGMVLSFYTVFASGYVVIEEFSLLEALHEAWRLFTSHWLVSIEVALVILLVDLGAMFLTVAGFFILFLPSLLFWMLAVAFSSYTLLVVAFVFGMLLCTLLVLFVAAILSTYTTTVWTYLFMKMHHVGVVSRIQHWLK